MSYDHMSKHDIASLASVHFTWIGTLVMLAKQNKAYSETLLDIAEYLSDEQFADFADMADELK